MGGGLHNCLNEEGEGSDISDSEINQYKEAVYKLLKFRTYKIRCPNGDLRCPFCVGVEKHEYHRLLEHSIRVAEGSTESGKQRANHLAMAKYLVIDMAAEVEHKRKCSLTALSEKKSMLESELDQAKEDANAVAKLQEVEKTCLDLQQNLQSMEEKLSNLENDNHVLCQKLRKAEENYRGMVEKHKRSVFKERRSNNKLEEFRIELIKMDLKNNEMAEKLRKAKERRKEKDGALRNLEDAYHHSKEQQSNDELQEVRLELIKLLSDLTSHSYINYSFGVKRMGWIDEIALKNACNKKFPFIVTKHKLDELHSSANTIYKSYEIIVDDKGNPQGLLKKNDKKLQGLKDELGEEVYNVLFVSLFVRHEYRKSGSYMGPEMWNFKENRKATLKEVICYISSLLKTQNEERKSNLRNKWDNGGPGSTDGKKVSGHVATPHPAKKGKALADKPQQTPKSRGSHSCKDCNKTFGSEGALDSHSKAKHSSKK